MAFPRPSLTDLITRVLADLSSRVIGVSGAVLRRSVLGAIGRALAGASHELHGRLDFIAKQIIITTAEVDYLERWASVWGVQRKPAEFASGSVTFTGGSGAEIAAGTIVQRQDGAQFATVAAVTLVAGTATASVLAVLAGAAGNTAAAVTMTLQQPIQAVQSSAVVAAGGITNGSNTESDDAFRARLLARIQSPPHGGAEADYEQWALEVPGVTRAWVYPMEMGAGTVTVRFVRDDDSSIIPDSTEVSAVYAYIEERRPVTAELFVVAPVASPLNMTIQLRPNNPSVQAAVTAELTDLIRREAEPGGTTLISQLREAVSLATGTDDYVIVTPTGNVTSAPGDIVVIGTITYQAIP